MVATVSLVMGANHERYVLAAIKQTLADGNNLPAPDCGETPQLLSEIAWLVEECERLARANRALDRELARLELELRLKDAEFTAAEMELLDVSEALCKCRQQSADAHQAAAEASSET